MADMIDLGWIQLQGNADRYINLDNSSSPSTIVIGTNLESFYFIFQLAVYGAYGLLASHDLCHVVEVVTNPTVPMAYLAAVVPAPAEIISLPAEVTSLPAGLDDSVLFSINNKNGMFQIKNKKFSREIEHPAEIVLELYAGDITSGTKIVANLDSGDQNQRWTFKTQLSTNLVPKFVGLTAFQNGTNIKTAKIQIKFVPDVSPDIIDEVWISVNRGQHGTLIAGKEDPEDPTKRCYEFIIDRVTEPHFKKDRIEMGHAFARFSDLPSDISTANALAVCKYVNSRAPTPAGLCPLGAHMKYSFKLYIPTWVGKMNDTNVIFAQWHRIPTKTLFKLPDPDNPGRYRIVGPLPPTEAAKVWKKFEFKRVRSEFAPDGYTEQGGNALLAMHFQSGNLSVSYSGDSSWFSDKYKPGTNQRHINRKQWVYSQKIDEIFLINQWITFDIDVKWAEFVPGTNILKETGSVVIDMIPNKSNKSRIVDAKDLLIGANDEVGYFFKFGIYRHSHEPAHFYFKDISQTVLG